MVMVRGTLLFSPPMSSLTKNNSTRGSEKASLSNTAPSRTDTTATAEKQLDVTETKFHFCFILNLIIMRFFSISIRECDVLKGLNAMFQKRISPVVGLMVKRSTLGPIRPYFTTAFGPISLSVAKTGPFRISTVVPGRQRDRSCFVHSYLQLFFRVMVDPKPMLGKPDTRWEYTKKDH